ncbi:hypothetical protein ACIQYZ_13480 [Rhodococcus erythropolis]
MPAITATVTPQARLSIALSEWRSHCTEIARVNEVMDFAAARVLEEQEVGFLNDIADAADALMTDQIVVVIRVENTYATGESFARRMVVTAPAPADDEDVEDWAADHLLQFTGEGGGAYADIEAIYEVTVLQCDARPELVGVTASGQG